MGMCTGRSPVGVSHPSKLPVQQQPATSLVPMWVCPVAPVLESAWVSLGVHVAVYVGISWCLHVTFASLLILDNSPLHPFPLMGPEPSLRGGLPYHWLSFFDLHPWKQWFSPLPLSFPPSPGLSFTPDKGGPQAEKGHQRRHVARGGKKGGYTQHRSIPPSLPQPPKLATLII